jgi:hypothetical protein
MDAVAPANIILVHGEANEMLRLKGELVSGTLMLCRQLCVTIIYRCKLRSRCSSTAVRSHEHSTAWLCCDCKHTMQQHAECAYLCAFVWCDRHVSTHGYQQVIDPL